MLDYSTDSTGLCGGNSSVRQCRIPLALGSGFGSGFLVVPPQLRRVTISLPEDRP